jgi:hypothetical protein
MTKKRKAPEDLSSNKNTVRELRRRANLSPTAEEYRKKKAADATWLKRSLDAFSASNEYQSASSDERSALFQAKERKLINKR